MVNPEATSALGGAREAPNKADCQGDPRNKVHVLRG